MVCTHRLYFLYLLLCFVLFWGRMFLYPGEHPAAAHSGQFRFTGRPGPETENPGRRPLLLGRTFFRLRYPPEDDQRRPRTALHNGYELPVTASVTDMFFETRRYDHVILPAGTYTAVRIELGAAAGKNWWCVLYPPLCVSAAQTGFTEEEAQISDSLLQQDALPHYRARLAVVEWWETLCRWAKEKGAD